MERETGRRRHQLLSRPAGVAGSHGRSGGMLCTDLVLSTRRSLWDVRSSQTRRGVDCREYRRGAHNRILLTVSKWPIFADALAKILARVRIEIVKRSDQAKGFVTLPKRWIVERSIAWLNRCRRLAKDWRISTSQPLCSFVSPRSASCCEGSAIPRELSSQTLRTSQGSLKELETHLLLAGRVGIAETSAIQPILDRCEALGKMLRRLIRSLQDKASASEVDS